MSAYQPPDDDLWTDADLERVRSRRNGDLKRPAPKAAIDVLDGPQIAAALPELEYLIREIGMVAGASAPDMIAGYGFSGKTVAAQSLLVSLASGHAIWGVYGGGKPRRVLHIDLEQGARLTRRRYQRIALAMRVDLPELGDDIALAAMPGLQLCDAHVPSWRALMGGRDLILVDSLRAATRGQDENSSEIRGGLDMLGGLSEETGCHVLLLHHARKPTEGSAGGAYSIRGSGAIFDGLDSAYVFTAAKGEATAVQHARARSHGELLADFALVISDVEIEGDPRAGLRVQVHGSELIAQQREDSAQIARKAQSSRDASRVDHALQRAPGLGTKELRVAARLSGDRLVAALLELGPAVEVREEVSAKGKTCRHYLNREQK